MTDDEIIHFAKSVIVRGFVGEIAFHYYNDPCLYPDRMQTVMEALPEAKFILWTNGFLLHNLSDDHIKKFNRVCVSVYEEKDMQHFQTLCKIYPNMTASWAPHDNRITMYDQCHLLAGGCVRPSRVEMVVNYYGHLRMCCGDYRGKVSIGHISEEHVALLDKWESVAMNCYNAVYSICFQCLAIHSPAIRS
jgi:hypothetical protein